MGEAIRSYFGDGEKLGLKLTYVEQKEILGTGNAAGVAEPYVDGDFVLIYGDLLFGQDAVKACSCLSLRREKPLQSWA